MFIRPFCMIAALALFLGWSASAAEAAPRNVLFILDVSGSMAAQIDGERKMEVAKRTFNTMMEELPDDTRVGVQVYGYKGDKDCSVIDLLSPIQQPDAANVARKVNALSPSKGATPIADSLKMGADIIRDVDGRKAIVLISDGKENCDGDPVAMARMIREDMGIDVTIHVIGFGLEADETEALKAIATAGNGRYFGAGSADELARSFAEVKQEVAQAEPEPEPKPEPEPEPEPAEPQRTTLFEEDFEGDYVADAISLRNENRDNWILDSGAMVILTQARVPVEDADGKTWNDYPNMLVADVELPGSFEVVTEWMADFQMGDYWGQEVLIGLESGSGQRLMGGFRFGDYNTVGQSGYVGAHSWKEEKGERGGKMGGKISSKGPRSRTDQHLELRLVKERFDVTFYWRPHGEEEWRKIGTQRALRLKDPKILVIAYDYEGKAPATTAELLHLEVNELK